MKDIQVNSLFLNAYILNIEIFYNQYDFISYGNFQDLKTVSIFYEEIM